MRFAIHLHLGYHRHTGQEGRRLAWLTRADAVIGACFNAGAATCLCSDSSGFAVAALALGLFFAVLLVSGATLVATRDSQIQRGSEWIRNTAGFAWLVMSLEPHSDLFGKPFLWLIRKATPVRNASCYIVCLLAVLLAVAAAESATAIKPIRDAAHLSIAGDGSSADSVGNCASNAGATCRTRRMNSRPLAESTPSPPGWAMAWEDRAIRHDERGSDMAERTKADRQAAAKKGAATRQRKAAEKSGADAKRSAEGAGKGAISAAKSLGEAVKQAGKAVASRVGGIRKGR